MESGTDSDGMLSQEAEAILPLVQWALEKHSDGRLSDYDFAGIFILGYLGMRRPKKWLGGKCGLCEPGTTERDEIRDYRSMRIQDMPLLLSLLNEDYVRHKCGGSLEDVSVIDLFARFQFVGIRNKDNYINNCLVNWALGRRPCVLLFRIPSPMEVLRMQSRGTRVVTLFTTRQELSSMHVAPLYYMEGSQNHAKDPLEFLIHDLKHMENFVDPACFREQVGFFKSMLAISNGNPRNFFQAACGYDKLLWRELEYVISDM